MIICHSRRFIFFSAPKTGSETVRALLSEFGEEPVGTYRDRTPEAPFYSHMSPAEAARVFAARGWPFMSYRRLTCVRNPFDRLVSLYEMICRVDGVWRLRDRMGLSHPDFGTWLRSSRPDGRGGGGRPHQRWRRFGTYASAAWEGGLITDVVQTEDLGRQIAVPLADLGIELSGPLPHLNRGDGRDCASYYDTDRIDLVTARYGDDLARFGYRAPVLRQAA